MTDSIEQGLLRSVAEITALHYVNSPAHGHAVIKMLLGEVTALDKKVPDDPLLCAYLLSDKLPSIAAHVKRLYSWSNEIINATPDDLMESGARL